MGPRQGYSHGEGGWANPLSLGGVGRACWALNQTACVGWGWGWGVGVGVRPQMIEGLLQPERSSSSVGAQDLNGGVFRATHDDFRTRTGQ